MTVDNVVKIKENISDLDLGNVIETVVEFMIRKDNNGYIIYTPYYQRYGLIVGISKYLIEGIKFDKDDDYPDLIAPATQEVLKNTDNCGIFLCGSGVLSVFMRLMRMSRRAVTV